MGSFAPPTKTIADVMKQVKRQFGDESGVQLEDADIIGWINDAQTRINSEGKVLQAKSTQSTVAGQAAYGLTGLQIQDLGSIHVGGVRIPSMTFAQAEETVSQADPTSAQTAAYPMLWYEWANSITFWPVPSGVLSIDVYYVKSPTLYTTATATTTVLDLPDDYFQDIVTYVLQQAYEMDEDWQASQIKGQQFFDSLQARGEDESQAQNRTFDTITVVDDYY